MIRAYSPSETLGVWILVVPSDYFFHSFFIGFSGVWCVVCVVCGVWCVVCGVWCVVCGVWCVVCGVWCVVCGVWCVVCGVWCVVCGVWCMVSGVWCLVYGVCCMVCGVWSMVYGVWFKVFSRSYYFASCFLLQWQRTTFSKTKGQSVNDYQTYSICRTFYLLLTKFGVSDFKYLFPVIWLG